MKLQIKRKITYRKIDEAEIPDVILGKEERQFFNRVQKKYEDFLFRVLYLARKENIQTGKKAEVFLCLSHVEEELSAAVLLRVFRDFFEKWDRFDTQTKVHKPTQESICVRLSLQVWK